MILLFLHCCFFGGLAWIDWDCEVDSSGIRGAEDEDVLWRRGAGDVLGLRGVDNSALTRAIVASWKRQMVNRILAGDNRPEKRVTGTDKNAAGLKQTGVWVVQSLIKKHKILSRPPSIVDYQLGAME